MASVIPVNCDSIKSATLNPSWWDSRSRVERILCGVAGICLVMVTAMAVSLAIIGYRYQSLKTGICLKPGCIKAAAAILDSIDEKVDPCDNFYEFACGGWLQKLVMPDDRASVDVFDLQQNGIDQLLRSLVKNGIKDTDPLFIKNMKSMYDSCMNTTHIEMLGNDPLVRVIREAGGWPAVDGDKWEAYKFDWMEALFALRRVGFDYNVLLEVYVRFDMRDGSKNIITLGQNNLGMPDRNYLLKGMEDPLVSAYYQLMVDSAVLLGANKATATEEMREALKFEMNLANITVPREESRNVSLLYNKITVNDLYKLAPDINWEKYFNNLLLDKISRSELVNVYHPVYLQRVSKLLVATDKRIIANYLMWRVVQEASPTLHKSWGELFQNYNSKLTGKVRQKARWEHCLGTLSGNLRTALSYLYVKNHFKEGSKDLALEMANYIHREFLNILEDIDWMDVRTKERAKEKADHMATYMGYPDELLEEWRVSDIFKGLHLNSTSYFENARVLKKWEADYYISKLRHPNFKRDYWKRRATAADVNAYYHPSDNSVELPAGILQGLFFDKDRPNYLNFGGIGSIIGHEITHGFDDRGRQFDKDGNNINWWEPETDSKFKDRAQCIIDQYGNFTVKKVELQFSKLNGINTQGENMADNGGIKEAFRAYLQWIRDHGSEDFLPGIKYSPTQLFWISTANVECTKYRPEKMVHLIMTNSHSLSEYRINGPLSNLPEFSKEFGCPVGSPMNPAKKCSVW